MIAPLALLPAGACASGPPCGAAAAREEAAVHAAVIDSFHVRIPPRSEPVVVVRPLPQVPETSPLLGFGNTLQPDGRWRRFTGLSLRERVELPVALWLMPGSLFAGYRAANMQPAPPPADHPVTGADADVVRLSRVGFDRGCGRALVGYSHSGADGGGRPRAAGYVFLERDGVAWRIRHTLGTFD